MPLAVQFVRQSDSFCDTAGDSMLVMQG